MSERDRGCGREGRRVDVERLMEGSKEGGACLVEPEPEASRVGLMRCDAMQ